MDKITVNSSCTAPKGARVPFYLEEECYVYKVELKLKVKKGFFNEKLSFKLTGDLWDVEKVIENVIARYED